MKRKEEKRSQEQKRISELNKLHVENARRTRVADGDEDEELRNTVIEDSSNVEVANNTSQHAPPTFQVGEIISVEGDTTERGYTCLFIHFLRRVFLLFIYFFST